MKKSSLTIRRQALVLLLAGAGLASCDSTGIELLTEHPSSKNEANSIDNDYQEAWHDKMRTLPYPKLNNELVINPSPLIVPQSMKVQDSIQFELSQDANFNESTTGIRPIPMTRAVSAPVISSKFVAWNMFNPHQVLQPGTWYWRYRQKSKSGQSGDWSNPIQFQVESSTEQFVTPQFDVFLKNMPTTHPRLYVFLDSKLDAARQNITKIEGYRNMLNNADEVLDIDVDGMANPYTADHAKTIRQLVQHLHTAYLLTWKLNNAELQEKNPKYKAKMLSTVRTLLTHPLYDTDYFIDNFTSSNIALCFIPVYDVFYNELTAEERSKIEQILNRLLTHYFPSAFGYEENHIFDNHFWQLNMRTYLQCAYLLADKAAYRAKVLPILEYLYEIWTARAPAMGYNRDGGWENGTKYFNDNVETLYYVPMLFGHITGFDFLQHPWYGKAGETMVYTWPPSSKSLGFGDGVEWYDTPTRQRVAFADFLAREKGDTFAGWYAAQQLKALRSDPDLRLYRMCNFNKSYNSELPKDYPSMVWLQDMGEVLVHSDLAHTANDFSLSFRSSTFGSGSHTLADQNSFNLLYKGDYVYHNSGYFQNFSDKHNLLSYRHSRAHNTLLVNGIGQPYSTNGYGDIVRAMGGDHIAYCLGDASHAYNGISDDELWVKAFKEAGISQTAEYGFGTTPLKKYRRHLLMLYPNILIIYDELEASQAVTWDWLLHSDNEFAIATNENTVTTENTKAGFVARTQLFADQALQLSKTNQFFCDPASGITNQYPRQWHLTAKATDSRAARILAIIQVADKAADLQTIGQNGNVFSIGAWRIEATMASIASASLKITNISNPEISFIYDATTYSTLYDTVNGKAKVQTQTDRTAIKTRSR